jgi:hypothetical protein
MKEEERKLQKLNAKLEPIAIENNARKVGFIIRKRKIQAVDFVKTFCLMTFYKACSLSICAQAFGIISNSLISKQGLSKRLTVECVEFFRTLLFMLIAQQSTFKEASLKGMFSHFARVLLQDSTNFSLPKKLAGLFPGSKNQSNKSTAILKIQCIYNLLSEAFVSFKLTPYTCNDQRASSDILAFLQKGDLVLRDLGYFSVKVLKEIADKDAYFLSRYLYKTNIYDEKANKINLLEYLRKYGALDINLCLGSMVKLPVRIVAIPLPQGVASERKRKLRQNRDKRLNAGKEQLALLDWNIFITNVPASVWDTKIVAMMYGIRWRIEIIFKAWKSHFNLTVMTEGSSHYIETLIYAKLIWITLFQIVFRQLYVYIFTTTGKHLSLLKVAQFFQQNFWALILSLHLNKSLDIILEQCSKHCCYEKRKKRLNFQERMCLLSLS